MSKEYSIKSNSFGPIKVMNHFGHTLEVIAPFGHTTVTLPMTEERLKTTILQVAEDKHGRYLPAKLIGAIMRPRGKK